jgi:SAM-dependent methyltransferase
MHGPGLAPSPWVQRWAHLVPPGANVLDVACGGGRHVRWFAARGHAVTGVDRDAAATEGLRGVAKVVVADIEAGPWPFALLPAIVSAVAPGGALLYETFTQGQQDVGKPSRPDFLLQPGELLQACAGLHTVAYEDGFLDGPPRFVQRICALREAAGSTARARHPLEPPTAR